MGDSIGRRFFLRVLGATGAAAGCSPKHAPEKLIPLLVPPENMVPGKPLFYRTVCRECPAACGVTARSREGRVVKLEGSPDEPTSGGALCARGQAAVQGLYAPDRFPGPMARGADGRLAPISWDAAIARLADALKAAAPGRIRIVTRPEPGSVGAVQRAFMSAFGAAPEQRVVVEARGLGALRAGPAALYGRAELPAWDLSAARAVVSFGADFAETWLSPVELARGFASGRGKPDPQRTLFTWIGPRLGATGAVADDWIPCRPGSDLGIALSLLRAIAARDPSPEGAAVRTALAGFKVPADVDAARVEKLAGMLLERRPSALLASGSTELHAVVLAINQLLGNVGRTVLLGQDPLIDPPSPGAAPADEDVLLLHHAAPPGNARLVVSFSGRPDAAAAAAHLVLPDHHWLESFGDVEARKGVVALSQPSMTPLHDTRAASDVLIQAAKRAGKALPMKDVRTLTRSRATELKADPARGVVGTRAAHEPRPFDAGALVAFAQPKPAAPDLALHRFPTALAAADPNAASWLREIPDAMSRNCWSSWCEMSPAEAARIGARDGDLLDVAGAQLTLFVHAGLVDGVVAVPADAAEVSALDGPVAVRVLGPGSPARIPGAQNDAGRGLLPAAAEVAGREEHKHGHEHSHDRGIGYEHPPEEHPYGMRPAPSHPVHRWAMAIDLDRCTGCQACVVACYAENNVPVNGPEAARHGRNQAWLRIQRSIEPGPKIEFLPSLCQHCDRAPCEPVCPVYATYHNAEGLNAMVYNRCIGTRYCANNCPYDARVFNWRDPQFAAPLDLQLNPDVTVRSKGVMEKCTFCVQRIRFAENEARSERRNVYDGEVVPACAQTCPAQAITFGDLEDPASRINRTRQDPRAYRLLEELDTGPAVTYLARGGRS
jgi:molybdopterin-containing oxidoreductase family iron-sulfur binding subunit